MRTFITLCLTLLLTGSFSLLSVNTQYVKARIALRSEVESNVVQVSPLTFIENVGQWDTRAKFQVRSTLGTFFLLPDGFWLTIVEPTTPTVSVENTNGMTPSEDYRGVHLRIYFENSNPTSVIQPFAPVDTSVNYLEGNDPSQWHRRVPIWRGVRYIDLYPNVDLELSEQKGQFVPRVVVHGSAFDASQVQLRIEGAERIEVVENSIRLTTSIGIYHLPLLEIVDSQGRSLITPPVMVNDTRIKNPFATPLYEVEAPKNGPTVDQLPSNLIYSTFLGGSDYESGLNTAVGSDGSMYVVGSTWSFDFPTTPGAFDPIPCQVCSRIIEGYVVKFRPDGQSLAYATYIGGHSDSDYPNAIRVGADGAAYVVGYTRSSDFPATPGTPGGFRGDVSAFAFKLTPDGSNLAYSLVLGGEMGGDSPNDRLALGNDLALGIDGTVTIVGHTNATDFPLTPNAFDTVLENPVQFDAFVTRIATDGSALLFSTFLGGIARDFGAEIEVDRAGNTYVTGNTVSKDFPVTPGAYDTIHDSSTDFFITKFNRSGSDLVYSTFVGGNVYRDINSIGMAIDSTGAVYVVGETYASDFPTTLGVYDRECGYQNMGCDAYNHDGVVFKLNPEGSDLIYSTFLGGSEDDHTQDIEVDIDGNVYITGAMPSPEFPYTPGAYRGIYPGLIKLNPTASTLLYSGAKPGIGALGQLALQAPRVVVLAGNAGELSNYVVTSDAYQPTIMGDLDATLARMVLPPIATEQIIAPSGGQLTSAIDQTNYVFAPDTFTDTVLFTHAPRHPLSLPPFAPLVPIGHTFANTAVLSGTSTIIHPQQLYQMNISYTNAEVQGIEENGLTLYFWNGTTWQPEPTAVHYPDTNRITANPAYTGWWVVLAQPNQVFLPSIRR